jgi:hypothetical protein
LFIADDLPQDRSLTMAFRSPSMTRIPAATPAAKRPLRDQPRPDLVDDRPGLLRSQGDEHSQPLLGAETLAREFK